MKKLIVLFLISFQVRAADYTFEFTTSDNSISDAYQGTSGGPATAPVGHFALQGDYSISIRAKLPCSNRMAIQTATVMCIKH